MGEAAKHAECEDQMKNLEKLTTEPVLKSSDMALLGTKISVEKMHPEPQNTSISPDFGR